MALYRFHSIKQTENIVRQATGLHIFNSNWLDIPNLYMIHAVCSEKHAQILNRCMMERSRSIDILIQINTSLEDGVHCINLTTLFTAFYRKNGCLGGWTMAIDGVHNQRVSVLNIQGSHVYRWLSGPNTRFQGGT